MECRGAPGDVGIARGACQGDADRTVARGERGAKRTDLDRGRQWCVANQNVRCGQREPVHRAARRQTVALGAVPSAVLHRACGSNR